MHSLLTSPSVEIFCDAPHSGEKPTLFALGGRAPEPAWLAEFVRANGADVWGVDAGISACRAAGVPPSVIVGDMDSASRDDWEWASDLGAREHRYDSAKNLTDFQLALDLWEPRGALVLTGCFGGRFDHLTSVANTFACSEKIKKAKKFPRCMIDHAEGIFLLSPPDGPKKIFLRFHRKIKAISLLPMTEICRGVSIRGVRWPLTDVSLERAYPWAVSNELAAGGDGTAEVCCAEGVLAVYWCGAEGLL
ncbi:thiamine diphosphokinase [Synergistaceae bacterium OttesenSCG-928-I11]|nr:thiamine diphosphokinase [Synergistaceae bacterium OttesenSCG-928-I11]